MKIFDTKLQSQKIEQEILYELDEHPQKREKTLAILQIGDDASSEKFIKIKLSLCEKLGIKCDVLRLNEHLSDEVIFDQVRKIFENKNVSGGIIQLPLPRKSLDKVLELIPVEKDIDVISFEGKNKFYSGDFSILPPVIMAFNAFISENKIEMKNLKSTVVGNGELVGKPISFFLNKNEADVNVLTDYDGAGKLDCRLLVLCAGSPLLVKGDNISVGCDVVDFGSSVVEGKCVGDLDMNSNLEHLGCISKSPGGMGPLVVRYLLLNWSRTA